jgi:hypothetical protein
VEQLCGLAVTGTGYVQDNSPLDGTDTRFRAGFYVLIDAPGSSEVTLFRAFTDDAGSTEAFSISYKSATGKLVFNPAGATSAELDAPEGWVRIEFDWQAGGDWRIWVNTLPNPGDDNPDSTAGAGSQASVGMVRLGAPGPFGDANRFTYDSYQSNRTLPIDQLLIGDADKSGDITNSDLAAIEDEVLDKSLATGQPDCNSSGEVSGFDLVCVQNEISNP